MCGMAILHKDDQSLALIHVFTKHQAPTYSISRPGMEALLEHDEGIVRWPATAESPTRRPTPPTGAR